MRKIVTRNNTEKQDYIYCFIPLRIIIQSEALVVEKNKKNHGNIHSLWLEVSHVRPSYRPSPVVAQDGWTYQLRSLIRVRPSFS